MAINPPKIDKIDSIQNALKPTQKINQLKTRIDVLEKMNNDLKEQLRRLEIENEDLKIENIELQRMNDDLAKKSKKSRKDN